MPRTQLLCLGMSSKGGRRRGAYEGRYTKRNMSERDCLDTIRKGQPSIRGKFGKQGSYSHLFNAPGCLEILTERREGLIKSVGVNHHTPVSGLASPFRAEHSLGNWGDTQSVRWERTSKEDDSLPLFFPKPTVGRYQKTTAMILRMRINNPDKGEVPAESLP